jgi:hypothetical protein
VIFKEQRVQRFLGRNGRSLKKICILQTTANSLFHYRIAVLVTKFAVATKYKTLYAISD